jgi:ABC-type phosphate transport system substrate-binding protein
MSSLSILRRVRRSVIAIVALACIGVVAGGARTSLAQAPGAESFVVVVNASNPATRIERELLSKLFLKRVAKWPHGAAVLPVDLSVSEMSRVQFTQSVHRKSVGAVRAFWQQQIFSGRDVPPPEKGTESDVLTYVRSNPGAVGYVSSSIPLNEGVKAIPVGDR